jgi:UDP-N-acetylmuramate dehydrogenase
MDTLSIDQDIVTVGAGFSMIKLATIVANKGLSGLEFAGGIPGTVGGAVYMNAGAHGSDISSVLESAQILFEDGKIKVLKREELCFSYRTSVLQGRRRGICLEATFKLKHGDRDEIMKLMTAHKDYRRKTQPLQQPCCGSVFRNPKPYSSGQLIERAGLKGYRVGDAQISTKHANFIVNLGQAKAKDVLILIKHIQETIFSLYGVELQPEVEVIGED